MKILRYISNSLSSWLLLTFLLAAGCSMSTIPDWVDGSSQDPDKIVRLRISALTEFTQNPEQPGPMQIKAQVELLNGLEDSLNKPGKWRFELYEFVPRSSDPRGFRLLMWPEIDLNSPEENQIYWKDFLRGYEFYLPLEFVPEPKKKFILEATFMAEQRRYNDLFKMQYFPNVQ
jgi:hypothetical protein